MKKNELERVGINIKKCREMRDYTQEYLANELDISVTSYRNIENGKTAVTLKYLYDIASILNVDIKALLFYNEQDMLGIYGDHKTELKQNIQDVVYLLRGTQDKIIEMVNQHGKLVQDMNAIAVSVVELLKHMPNSTGIRSLESK